MNPKLYMKYYIDLLIFRCRHGPWEGAAEPQWGIESIENSWKWCICEEIVLCIEFQVLAFSGVKVRCISKLTTIGPLCGWYQKERSYDVHFSRIDREC